ncbi:hypothetical protein KGO5_05657 [Sinorhizobium sp. KGO-5]|uniref:hypothetical protein n=1 Tax=Sinorhizobium sp. KGO-5 TaxID=1470810 RepID=UPI00294A9A3B|nr:hypothetical protein KGO5_05657 [Sinorhizobium sp. KGO-5]
MLSDKNYCVTIISALTIIAFVFVMRFLPEFLAWQGWDWCGANCNVRDWLEATSGWIGASIAAVAAVPLLLQLRVQQTQTAFTVGDASPTMDAIEHLNDSSELVVRIVNWNRRAIVVRFLDVESEDTIIMPNRLTIDGKVHPSDLIDLGVKPFVIKGWENRSASPPHAEIRLAAFKIDGEDLSFRKNWKDIHKITATIQILGDSHRVKLLKADTRLLWR